MRVGGGQPNFVKHKKMFSVVKVTLEFQMSVHLSGCHKNPLASQNHNYQPLSASAIYQQSYLSAPLPPQPLGIITICHHAHQPSCKSAILTPPQPQPKPSCISAIIPISTTPSSSQKHNYQPSCPPSASAINHAISCSFRS